MKAEIGDIIVIVNPAVSDSCYGLGDKFKVLIEDCDDESLRGFGTENTSYIEHKEYEVLKKEKTI